jgi:CRP/FNR family transcriptional regulator
MGDPADALFLVESGSVKVGVISDDGKEKTLYLSGRGQFFGELCICGVARHPDQAVALESSTVSSFRVENVTALLARRPELAKDFFQLVCGRLLDCQDQAVSLAYDSVPRRLAKELLRLAGRGADRTKQSSVRVELTPTHEELAAVVGTSRGMISTTMNEFREKGLVTYAPKAITVFEERLLNYLEGG